MSEPTATPPPPPPEEPPPPQEPPAQPEGNEWERRTELGFVQGLFGAIKSFILTPGDTFAVTKKSGDLASPILFAILISLVTAFIGQLWAMLFGTSLLTMLPAEAQQQLGWLMMTTGGGFLVGLIMMPIFTVVGIFIGGAILHVMLLLVGGLDTSEGGFEGSLRVVGYSSVGNVAKLIPVIGDVIATLWMIVLLVIGVTRLHGTSEGKAVAAVLLPVVLCCVCIGAAMMIGFGAIMSGVGG